jgi:hypothetical protein
MSNGQDNKLAAAGQSPPVRLFISYSHVDEAYRESLCKSLSLLRRQGIIEDWHDRRIEPGADWSQEISSALANSRIVILLISMDFINSDYCFGNEMTEALKMHEQNRAKVIPILVRRCDWETAPFGKFQALPSGARPVKSWPDQDEAWTDVVNGLRRVIGRLSGLPEVASPQVISHDERATAPLRQQNRSTEIDFKRRQRLVDALMRCNCLQTVDSRNQIVGALPDKIAGTIQRHGNTLNDLMSIVDRVLQYGDGLPRFLEIVQTFEGETYSWKRVESVVSEIDGSLRIEDL